MSPRAFKRLMRGLTRTRKFHGFCLGAAKTGTTSLAEMFKPCYRSAHEPDVEDLTLAVSKVLGSCSGTSSRQVTVDLDCGDFDVSDWLLTRDHRLGLEMEASHPLGYMAPWLPRVFPDARFLVTIRDPLSWLKSRLNFHLHRSPAEWEEYRNLIWSRWHSGYAQQEKVLSELGLYSLDAYLAQYSEQYRLLLHSLPKTRTLLVNTSAIDGTVAEIAAFLDIEPTTISHSHANAMVREDSVIDHLPREFVDNRIREHCQWMNAFL